MPPVSVSPQPKQTSLSRRLWQTLEYLLDGCSEKEVARALAISCHTVHTYVKRLYLYFGVESRAELMARFVVPVRGTLLREFIEGTETRGTAELIDDLFEGGGRDGAAGFEGVGLGTAFGRGWVRSLVPQGNAPQGTLPKASVPGGGAGPMPINRPRPVLSPPAGAGRSSPYDGAPLRECGPGASVASPLHCKPL
jgi:DNA-binding CsgD family transcriptional regulator